MKILITILFLLLTFCCLNGYSQKYTGVDDDYFRKYRITGSFERTNYKGWESTVEKGKYKNGLLNGRHFLYYYYPSYFYDNEDRIKEKGLYHHGNKVGKFVSYYYNGKIESIKKYRNGFEKYLSAKNYYDNGQIKEKSFYNFFSRRKKYINYYPNGNIESIVVYKKGKIKNSVYYSVYYFENGQVKYNDLAINDSVTKSYKYFENGEIESLTTYVKGNEKGEYFTCYENGNTETKGIKIDDRHSDGEFVWYYESGKLRAKCNYINGKAEGFDCRWFKNGNLEYRSFFINGEMVGDAFWYYETGKPKSVVCYENGLMKEQLQFYESGNLYAINHYENNKTNSYKRIELYDDSFSKIMLVENYTKNLKQGEAIKYYPSGKIQQINNYIDDQDMGGYWYSEDGKQTEKISGVYRDKNFGRKE